jgi:cytochrome c
MIMILRSVVFVVLAASLAMPALADIKPLAQKNGCFACHSVDNKLLGPAWTAVAKKYRGDKSAAAKLESRIRAGGSGVWGKIPMPPNNQVSEADIKALVKGILALK